jgi:DNA-binding NtrC family response regulator
MRAQLLDAVKDGHGPLGGGEPEDFADDPEKFTAPGDRLVLIAGEDSLIRWVIGERLKAAGYHTIELAELSPASWPAGVDETAALVFFDWTLREGSHVAALADVRGRWPRLPVIVMTDDDEVRGAAVKLGATVLRKPFDITDIESAATRALARR